ncbi:MAG: phosphate/phosphite/phosphonate ABC transporter substrate-binding protein [Acidobacteriota bacterium]|nr:phosphate/phosphite/phosphonate ABC transporter substrate-binding protein [Acidobacteriota bacterium]MDH3785159.1 phosphate/phosphite/phosphonate ABC transporter substrate-binding protein [Acidobacteriota bacterium]
MKRTWILTAVVALGMATLAFGEPLNILAIAPGYPGNTEQAQPSMDALARSTEGVADLDDGDVTFTYYEQLDSGLARLKAGDVAAVLVPLPFFFQFADELALTPVLEAIQENGENDSWSLVALKDRISDPASLSGWIVAGKPGYSPEFVRQVALADWGAPPEDVEIQFSERILRDIRKAAAGESVAILLDQFQTASLANLSMARDLEVVTTSIEMPASIFCWVGEGAPSGTRELLESALQRMHSTDDGKEALGGAQLVRFQPLDDRELALLESLQPETVE